MKIGDAVKIKLEWRDVPDVDTTYIVIEHNGDRLLIEAQLGWPVNPVEIVRPEMIEAAS